MTLRRDFLCFTAGAVVSKTILPVAATLTHRRQLEAMAEVDPATRRMLAWWDGANRAEQRCFIIMLTRVHAGMPISEAGKLFLLEVAGQSDPDVRQLVQSADA